MQLSALDLGAESGRCLLGTLAGKKITVREVYRFPNVPVRALDSLHWDPLRLFAEVKEGLHRCAQAAGGTLDGIGVDTWGVDFALLGRDGELLGNPFHYRDGRTGGMMEKAFQRVPREEIYERTGIQCLPINSLYMLLSLQESPALEAASTLLMMPDLFNYWLTGEKACEFTDATTTQLYDQRTGDWARPILEKLGLPPRILLPVTQPGRALGRLLPSLAAETGLGPVPVLLPACHDTGSAVAAVPAVGDDWAFISSGTWSIVGVETTAPTITPRSLAGNMTNEGGVGGTVRFSKNVMGLWLVQECRRAWSAKGQDLSYDELMELVAAAPPSCSLVDPDDESFLRPGDMPARLHDYCVKTGQAAPSDRGALLRCILDSLADRYREVVDEIESQLGRRLNVIHIVGGGAQNRLLCQLTADACNRPVVAGPVEATAVGNLLVQAMALGEVGTLEEVREVVRGSFELMRYEPGGKPNVVDRTEAT